VLAATRVAWIRYKIMRASVQRQDRLHWTWPCGSLLPSCLLLAGRFALSLLCGVSESTLSHLVLLSVSAEILFGITGFARRFARRQVTP